MKIIGKPVDIGNIDAIMRKGAAYIKLLAPILGQTTTNENISNPNNITSDFWLF